mgnify:CR=1 FL=1
MDSLLYSGSKKEVSRISLRKIFGSETLVAPGTRTGVQRVTRNVSLGLHSGRVHLVLHSVIKREVDIREASTQSRFVIAGVMNPMKIIFCVTRIVSRVIMVLGRCVIQGQARVSRKHCSIDTIAALIHTVKVIARIS